MKLQVQRKEEKRQNLEASRADSMLMMVGVHQ